jgi:hypothetical protein
VCEEGGCEEENESACRALMNPFEAGYSVYDIKLLYIRMIEIESRINAYKS